MASLEDALKQKDLLYLNQSMTNIGINTTGDLEYLLTDEKLAGMIALKPLERIKIEAIIEDVRRGESIADRSDDRSDDSYHDDVGNCSEDDIFYEAMETPIDGNQYQPIDENEYQSIEEVIGDTQLSSLQLYPSDLQTQRSEENYYDECPIQRMNSSQMVCQNPLMDSKKKRKKKKFPFFNRNKATRKDITNSASMNEVPDNEYFTLSQIREDPDSLSSLGEIEEFDFSSDEGKLALDCIHRICGNIPTSELVSKIISKDLILQDKIGYILKKEDITACQQIKEYFSKFKESKEFLNIKNELTIEDMEKIHQYSLDDTTKISEDLNIVESVINEYQLQYNMSEMEKEHYSKKQVESLIKLSKSLKNLKEISIDEYKKISTNSHKTYVDKLREDSDIKSFDELCQSIIPIAFYCMKCNLPLNQITDILREINEPDPGIPRSNYEIFHLIFQHSTPIVKALCIDLYSFCSPVPFYYPLLTPINDSQTEPVFKLCHELWFTIPPCFAIASFGLGSASYLPIGKSELLNKIFNTDFTQRNLNDNHIDPFHFRSIDVQITKNIQLEGSVSSEEKRVAYFDCHGGVSMKLIKSICKYVNIMIIHVLEKDKNHQDFHRDMEYFSKLSKMIIVLVRDCKDVSLDPSGKHDVMHIPNLSTCKNKFLKSLKDTFRKIIHSEPDLFLTVLNPVQSVLSYLQDDDYEVIKNSIAKMNKITNIIEKCKVKERSVSEEPDFLSFYPLFVKYMSSFNRASQETDNKVVDQLNDQCASLMEELNRTTCSEIVPAFLELFDDDYSGLLLYKLSKYFMDLNKSSSHQTQKYHYSNDILWREALLTFKHNESMENYNEFTVKLKECISKQIMGGEPFEIIDGDNLGFYSKSYDILLEHYYKQQNDFDSVYNKGKKFPLSAAPTVISIFGPQSSGKSTLLNYCFGCKFITSAGRCTQGVYGSLFQMHEILNNSRNLLILDTEGLNSIESKTDAKINFDQTMALFCLAVSQIVIINVKGEIGSDLKRLLQVCAYSLNRLKVNKVNLPKIFLVLNQQADPNVAKYAGALKHLMDSLDSTFHTADSECVRISDLIKVSTNDLFVLPSAFNVESIADYPLCENDKSKARKFQPTTAFAEECSALRSAIFEAIRNRDNSDKPPFDDFSEWIHMAGHVWETCVKYQDIVMYRDLEEIAFAEKLRNISLRVIDEEIYKKQDSLEDALGRVLKEVDTIESCCDTAKILTEKMDNFDRTFKPCEEECRKRFNVEEKKNSLSGQFDVVYKQTLSNLNRLIYLYRKNYEDKIKFRIQYLLLEIKIRDSMKTFQEKIEYRIDDYINFSEKEKLEEFEKIWRECYEAESEDLDTVRSEHFENLYKNFKIECNFIENQHHIWNILRSTSGNFGFDVIINGMEWDILHGLKNPDIKRLEECYFCILNQSYGDFTKVTPYNPRTDCVYLSPNSFVRTKEKGKRYLFRKKNTIPEWVPKECYPIVKICSGDFNNYEVVWGNCSEKSQILLLSSKLRNPNDPNNSCWDSLIHEVRKQALTRLSGDPKLSQTTIKQLINDLYSSIKAVNHEIKYIRTMLSNQAERQLSTLLFSYAFREYWNYQADQTKNDETRREEQKVKLRDYFFQKIDNRKMLKGEWDTKNMIANDKNISEKFAIDYLESIKRCLLTTMQMEIEKSFEELRESLTMEQLLLKANSRVNEAIECDVENTDGKEFVVEFICERNILLEKIFHQDWHAYQEKIKQRIIKSTKQSFNGSVTQMIDQLKFLIVDLDKTPENLREMKYFSSDNNFSLHGSVEPTSFQAREAPFKAMAVYLSKYLNPTISREQMSNFLENEFIVDGVRVERSSNSILPLKRFDHALDNENFKRLENTNIFNEFIFDIYLFATNFRDVLSDHLSNFQPNSVLMNQFKRLENEYLKDALGCNTQCPSCGKFCERGIHNDGSKCQILTGHQFSSMGGKVWKNDEKRTAILVMCDDYKDHMTVKLPEESMKWSDFKLRCGNEWNWDLPEDPKYTCLQETNRSMIQKIWDRFGKDILNYYAQQGTEISYVPLSLMVMKHGSSQYYICFVIDGTGSMGKDIERTRLSVSKIVKLYQKQDDDCFFRIVIYRDHCDEDIIETYPSDQNFTEDSGKVMDFLKDVKAEGGGDDPEAVLDGLATAVIRTNWKNDANFRNIIVHIFDAPPHGNFPDYEVHRSDSSKKNCCCCNHSTLCPFNWESHVWQPMKKLNLFYHGINTDKNFSGFENTMNEKLGELCGELQVCGKEQVDTAVTDLFINFHM